MESLTALLQYVPLATGGMLVAIGVAATFAPQPMSKKFGIAITGTGLPYVTATGIRDFSLGLIVFYLYYRQDLQALGFTHLAIAPVAVSDFVVVRRYGDKRLSWIHLTGAIGIAGYGAWILL